jgi:hypothetical protein
MHIAYHGTTVENARNILKEGLKEYSYYTPYLSTALSQGGPVIFIWYILDPEYQKAIEEGQWQFRINKVILPDDFIAIVHYKDVKLIKYNKEKYFELQKTDNPNICHFCRGTGELNYPDDGHNFLPGGGSFKNVNWKVKACPRCNGYGDIKLMEDMRK